MDAREVEGKMGYLGMERAARKILLDEKLVHRSTLIGIDLSQGNDFTAFASLFPLDDGCFGIKVRSYISDPVE